MTNREAYLSDLDDLQEVIKSLLSMVPVGKTKHENQMREQAENAAGYALATIACMRRDYIIED